MGKKILFTLSILLIFYPEIYAQLKTVNGAVFSSQSNQPIANAAIVVKGTSRGATSDEMGRFSISAAESQTLIISHVV